MNEHKPTVDAMEQRLQRSVQTATLCAYYGGLLTDKQREALRLHFEEDWSLGEVAEKFGVSRQNVHELITRSEEKLKRYEQKLGCAARARETAARLREALKALETIDTRALDQKARGAIGQARGSIDAALSLQEGEDDEHGI